MEKLEIRQEIASALNQLSKKQLEKILYFVNTLLYKRSKTKPDILSLAGTIDKDEIKIMEDAIQNDCEKINPDEW